MDVKVCTCIHCRNRKKTMKRNAKRIFRRMISKKRRAESYKVFNFYYS